MPSPSPALNERALYRPTPTETRIACETLLRCELPRETRAVVREIYENTEECHVADRA